MCEDPPADCLNNYDDLDLNDHRQRRLATYALEDYYGSVLSEYGREHLNLSASDTSQGIGSQWNKAKSRFKRLDDVEIPDQFSSAIHQLNDQRNTEVAHDYQANPPREVLERAREMAVEWSDWFIKHCKAYAEMQEEQTAEEMVGDMVGSITDSILSDDTEYYNPKLQDTQTLLEERAEGIQEDLETNLGVEGLGTSRGVDKELIQIILDAVELRNDKQGLDREYQYQEERMESQEAIRRSENTHECIVVDDYDDHGSIQVVNNEYDMADTSYVIHVDEFPDCRDDLIDLDVNDVVSVEVKVNRHGEEVIRSIQ